MSSKRAHPDAAKMAAILTKKSGRKWSPFRRSDGDQYGAWGAENETKNIFVFFSEKYGTWELSSARDLGARESYAKGTSVEDIADQALATIKRVGELQRGWAQEDTQREQYERAVTKLARRHKIR